MKPNDAAPEEVNLLRRFLAVAIFIPGMLFVILLSAIAGWNGRHTRIEKVYDWLFALIIKINPNFDT